MWVDEGPVRDVAPGRRPRQCRAARAAGARPPASRRRAAERRAGGPDAELPMGVVDELERRRGHRRAAELAERLAAGRRAFERDRYQEARGILAPLAQEAPGVAGGA